MPRTLLHIGTHKTGSSSFQAWLTENRQALREHAGVLVYEGIFGPNHFELGLLCQRKNRNGTGQVHFPDWCIDEWRADTRAHIARQVEEARNSGLVLLISSEVLSMLIHADELLELRSILGAPGPGEVSVAVVTRDPAAFLRSYRHEIGPGAWTDLRESAGYTEPDSWLVDYKRLLEVWRSDFGTDTVTEIEYEQALGDFGDVIPAIATALGIDANADGMTDWKERPWDWKSEDKGELDLDQVPDGRLREVAGDLLATARRREQRLSDLEANLNLVEDRFALSQDEAGALERHLANSRRRTSELELELKRQREDLTRARAALDNVTSSASWRITAPLRNARRFVRQQNSGRGGD